MPLKKIFLFLLLFSVKITSAAEVSEENKIYAERLAKKELDANQELLANVLLNDVERAALTIIFGGANPDTKSPTGKPVLSIAVSMEHSEIIEMLLDANADITLPDNDGKTPVDYAELLQPPYRQGFALDLLIDRNYKRRLEKIYTIHDGNFVWHYRKIR